MKISRSVTLLSIFVSLALAGCTSVPQAESAFLGEGAIVLSSSTSPSSSATSDAQAKVAIDLKASLRVDAQTGAGGKVRFEQVSVGRKNAMLVVENLAGELLGLTMLNPGLEPLMVPLSAPIRATGLISAALYLDNGDGVFDPTSDSILVGLDGAVMRVFFEYQIGLEPSTSPSPTLQYPSPEPSNGPTDEPEENETEDNSDSED